MPQNGSRYLLQFGRQGMVAHQNRWLAGPDELALAENVCFDNDLVQKEPAAPEYDQVGAVKELPAATWSGASDVTMAAVWFAASSSATFLGALVGVSAAAQASPWTVTVSATAAVGDLVVVSAAQQSNPTDNPLLTSLVDSKGNTYTRLKTQLGGAPIFAEVELWASVLTTGLTNAVDTLTLTFTHAGADARAVSAGRYSGVTSVTSQASDGAKVDNATSLRGAGYLGTTYPALLVATVGFGISNTATWGGGFGRDTSVTGAGAGVSLASKLALAAPGLVAQYDWNAAKVTTVVGTGSAVAGSNFAQSVSGAWPTFQAGDKIIIGSETHVVRDVP